MLYTQRQKQILMLLEERTTASVQELAQLLFASPSTIRRDLTELEALGYLQRIHGGAVITPGANPETLPQADDHETNEKKQIAELAGRFLEGNANYFFDSSTTAALLAQKLNGFQNVRVATNGLALLSALAGLEQVSVLSCGGFLRPPHEEFTGNLAIQSISNMSADVFFFSCAGFSLSQGATDRSDEVVAVKHAFYRKSKKHILLCDSSKFDREFFFKTFDLRDIDYVITDRRPANSAYIELLGDRLIYE